MQGSMWCQGPCDCCGPEIVPRINLRPSRPEPEPTRRAVFPVGDYLKGCAQWPPGLAFRLPRAQDSQDLCFLAGGDYRDFLRRLQPEMLMPGEIVIRMVGCWVTIKALPATRSVSAEG